MNPEFVLFELRERYAGLQSYQDDGVVLTQLPNTDFVQKWKFATFFTRPNRFRFDFTRHHPYPPLKHITTTHRIWQSAAGVFSWWQDQGIKSLSDIHLAIAGLKGISGGSSYTVSALLFASSPAFASEALTVQTVTGGETEGIMCHCVIATDGRKRPYRLYIGREDGLLYRVSSSVMEGTTSDEIHRNIRTNHGIDESNYQGP